MTPASDALRRPADCRLRTCALLAVMSGALLPSCALEPKPDESAAPPELETTLQAIETASLNAVADAVIFAGSADDLPGDRNLGASERLVAGRTMVSPIQTRRTLIRFDVAGELPSGAIITNAEMVLHCDQQSTEGAQTVQVSIHRVARAWEEGTGDGWGGDPVTVGEPARTGEVTWLSARHGQQTWATPGGDFVASASARVSVSGCDQTSPAEHVWSSTELSDDVQSWLDDPSSNHGWILLGDESSLQTSRRFVSSENTRHPTLRPELRVEYSIDGEACCRVDGACRVTLPGECSGTAIPSASTCSPNPCPQPTGACCGVGSCTIDDKATCEGRGDFFTSDGRQCTPNPCGIAGLSPFVDPLPIPSVATPQSGEVGGDAHYAIDMVETNHRFHRDLPETTVWAYDGQIPGPTIEASVDALVTVDWNNDLRDQAGALRTSHYLPVDTCPHGPSYWGDSARTVVHLHGAHVQPRFDGYPEYHYGPGTSERYEYTNRQEATTLWYHDHALGITRLNVYMGLAGFYLIRDSCEENLGLPSGAYEIPLLIQDRSFESDGSLSYPAGLQSSFFGDATVVNGKMWPYLNVDHGKYRFRVLNGSNSRTYSLSLSNGQPFHVIGSDGGLLKAPAEISSLTVAPAERYDIIIDFASSADGDEIVLLNDAPTPFPNEANPFSGVIPNVMKFVVGSSPGHQDSLPQILNEIAPIPSSASVQTRRLDLVRVSTPGACSSVEWTINGLGWDDIEEKPELGSVEIWEFYNQTSMMHPMHLHLVQFQVLNRQALDSSGAPTGPLRSPESHEDGWKDTAMAMPGQVLRVIARFGGFTGKFAYHCHILEHEDHEMMRQFRVVHPAAACDGDGVCGEDEDCESCPSDCAYVSGASCGDGLCQAGDGEDCLNCAEDCAGGLLYCCGATVGCGDARCTTDGFRCRAGVMPLACCGDNVCEGEEDSAGCLVDCAPSSVGERVDKCANGVRDATEEGIDCGGSCLTPCLSPAAHCADGLLNQGEHAIDCGGECCACAERIEDIKMGSESTCARYTSGLVRCWGRLGDSTQRPDRYLVDVGRTKDFSVQYDEVCGLSMDGKVDCVPGDRTSRGGVGDAEQIASGWMHTCVITETQEVKCWGAARSGSMGTQALSCTTLARTIPGLSGVVQLALGETHSCALLGSGQVWCWGGNALSQLGDGTTADSPAPQQVLGLPSDVIEIRAGFGNTCALDSSRDAYCWGWNAFGQAGIGSSTEYVQYPELVGGPWRDFAVGDQHMCAIADDNGVYCWGDSRSGAMGNAYSSPPEVRRPQRVLSLPASETWVRVAAGSQNACVLSTSGELWCWGSNRYGAAGSVLLGGDVSYAVPLSEGADRDGDGVDDVVDTCPDHPSPTQADSDGDGIGDACDTNACTVGGTASTVGIGRARTNMRTLTDLVTDDVRMTNVSGIERTSLELAVSSVDLAFRGVDATLQRAAQSNPWTASILRQSVAITLDFGIPPQLAAISVATAGLRRGGAIEPLVEAEIQGTVSALSNDAAAIRGGL